MASTAVMMGDPGKRTVDEASYLLKRIYLAERTLMNTLAGYHISIADWELKKTVPRHIWRHSLRADRLRSRILEMRYPRRDVDKDHDPALNALLATFIRCRSDAELVEGVYCAGLPALRQAYDDYLLSADALDDGPTLAFLPDFIRDIDKQAEEMEPVYAALSAAVPHGDSPWKRLLSAQLERIGGLAGGYGQTRELRDLPPELSNRPAYAPPLVPVRDPRFAPAPYHMPPRAHTKFIELQVWAGINHVNEMWAAEIPALVMWKWDDMPWEFYMDCARWSYDEARHSTMGEQRLKAWGFEMGVDYPVVADHYQSVSEHGELAVLALLHRLESGAPPIKSKMKTDFEAEGDTASSQDFDYDWADESIHLAYGHKWVLYRLGGDEDALEDLKEQTMEMWTTWIRNEHRKWDYSPFMQKIEAKIKRIEAGAHG